MSLQNVSLWFEDYVQLVVRQKQKVQEEYFIASFNGLKIIQIKGLIQEEEM